MIIGLDGKRIGQMEPIAIKDESTYIDATDEQLAYIRSVYEIFQGILRESELFPDGLPDMTFAVEKKIRKG